MVTVLLIDDDPIEAKLLRAYLEARFGEDFEMTHAYGLDEALTLLGARRFDHVLLDNRLPPFTDYRETLPRLRAGAPHAEPILVSASPRDAWCEAPAEGAPPVIDKFALRQHIEAGLLG